VNVTKNSHVNCQLTEVADIQQFDNWRCMARQLSTFQLQQNSVYPTAQCNNSRLVISCVYLQNLYKTCSIGLASNTGNYKFEISKSRNSN